MHVRQGQPDSRLAWLGAVYDAEQAVDHAAPSASSGVDDTASGIGAACPRIVDTASWIGVASSASGDAAEYSAAARGRAAASAAAASRRQLLITRAATPRVDAGCRDGRS